MDDSHDETGGVGTEDGAVLICARDQRVREELASVLSQEYRVRTAATEADALERIAQDVTVILVDDTSQECSLEEFIGAEVERARPFQIAAIVTESPAERVADQCDGFLRKPVDDEVLRSTVRWLHRRSRYERMLGAYYALSKRYASLTADPDATPGELQSFEERLTQLRTDLDDIGDSLDDEDAFQVALDRDGDGSA